MANTILELNKIISPPSINLQGYMFGAVATMADVFGRDFLVNEEMANQIFKLIGEKLEEHLERSNERITGI